MAGFCALGLDEPVPVFRAEMRNVDFRHGVCGQHRQAIAVQETADGLSRLQHGKRTFQPLQIERRFIHLSYSGPAGPNPD